MTNEQDNDNDEAIPPLTRHPSLLEGIIACIDCGELLVSVLDSRGIGYYVHEIDAPPKEPA